MTTKEIIRNITGRDIPIVFDFGAAAMGGACYFYIPETDIEVFLVATSDLENSTIRGIMVHEAFHAVRRSMGAKMYQKPGIYHTWDTICREEHIVNNLAESWVEDYLPEEKEVMCEVFEKSRKSYKRFRFSTVVFAKQIVGHLATMTDRICRLLGKPTIIERTQGMRDEYISQAREMIATESL